MKEKQYTVGIVGSRFRPPARGIVDSLPIGTTLYLIPEPSNPHDPNAIAVWLQTANIQKKTYEILDKTCRRYEYNIHDILAQKAWHLGYIPATVAASLKAKWPTDDDTIIGKFNLSANNAPQVTFVLPETEAKMAKDKT